MRADRKEVLHDLVGLAILGLTILVFYLW